MAFSLTQHKWLAWHSRPYSCSEQGKLTPYTREFRIWRGIGLNIFPLLVFMFINNLNFFISLWEKFIWVIKWWEVKGWGESMSTICVGKNTRNYIQCFLTLVLFTFCTCCILRWLVCIVVSCFVCIVVVVCIVVILCLFAVLCVYCSFNFRCRTAAWKSVFGRSFDRPPRHRFFLASVCLWATAEMVPKIPSCYYMLLM